MSNKTLAKNKKTNYVLVFLGVFVLVAILKRFSHS